MLLLDVVAKSWPHPLLSSLKSHSIYGVVVTQASYRSKGYSITAKYRHVTGERKQQSVSPWGFVSRIWYGTRAESHSSDSIKTHPQEEATFA